MTNYETRRFSEPLMEVLKKKGELHVGTLRIVELQCADEQMALSARDMWLNVMTPGQSSHARSRRIIATMKAVDCMHRWRLP